MEIELREHNQESYLKAMKMFETHRRVAIEQATATGKSYVIAKVIDTFKCNKVLFLAPNKFILNQFEKTFGGVSESFKKIDYMTYQAAVCKTKEEILKPKYELIILDEYHRCGASTWGKCVNNILDWYDPINVFGATATSIRWLDNQRNMSDEIFFGNVANIITFEDAIRKEILQKPKYVIGVGDIKDELKDFENKLNNLDENNSEKNTLKNIDRLKFITSNFDKLYGISAILKKYIKNERKFILFCEDIESLNRASVVVKKWFDLFNEDVNVYKVYAGNNSNLKFYEEFENANDGQFHIMVVVDILNEGVHIDGIDGLIMLRKTSSPNIFFQQLGRGLFLKQDKVPLIFDFVMNNQYVKTLSTSPSSYNDIAYRHSKKNYKRQNYEINEIFKVYDETLDILDVLEHIKESVESWNRTYLKLKAYKDKHGHLEVPKTNKSLYKWMCRQRVLLKSGTLKKTRYKKLCELDFPWNPVDERWMKQYNKLKKYKEKHGDANVPRSYEDQILATWVCTQRKYRHDMDERRKKLLTDIGFKFLIREENENRKWNESFQQLVEYKKIHGHCDVNSRDKENPRLANWVGTQRTSKLNGILSKEREDRLLEIGFNFRKRKKICYTKKDNNSKGE